MDIDITKLNQRMISPDLVDYGECKRYILFHATNIYNSDETSPFVNRQRCLSLKTLLDIYDQFNTEDNATQVFAGSLNTCAKLNYIRDRIKDPQIRPWEEVKDEYLKQTTTVITLTNDEINTIINEILK